MISRRGATMSDDILKRVQNELSENAISGLIHDEITSHKSDEAAVPIIKLKLAKLENTVKIHKPSMQPQVSAPSLPAKAFRVGGAGELLRGSGAMTVRLPANLTSSQKLKKAFRYRRFGERPTGGKYKRAQLPVPSVSEKDKGKLLVLKAKRKFFGAELLLPALLLFLVFSWLPIMKTFMISMHKYTTMNERVFVGSQNFIKIMNDNDFWQALMHSGQLSLIIILLGTWIPFFLALYVFEMRRLSGFVKVLYFIPFLTPAVPAAILWKWMYNQDNGLINSALSIFGGNPHIGWLTDPNLVLFSIAFVFIWKNTGWAMLIYMAGLQNIPRTLFEDASLMGAGVWTKIREIIIPALKPVILTVIFIQLLSGLQVFAEVYIMTNGGPQGSSEVIATYIYKKAFLYMDIGYAAGVAVFFLFLLITVTLFRMNINAAKVK